MSDLGETTSQPSSLGHPSLTAIFSPMSDQAPDQDGFTAASTFQPSSPQNTANPSTTFSSTTSSVNSSPTIPPSTSTLSPTPITSTPSPAIEIPMEELYIHYKEQAFSIDTPNFRIGRGDSCDLRVIDLQVSTNHCLIQHGILTDTRSTNGTSVNGKILVPHHQHILRNHDLIFIGATELIIGPKDRLSQQASSTSTSSSTVATPLDLLDLSATSPAEPASPTSRTSTSAPTATPFIGQTHSAQASPHGVQKSFPPNPQPTPSLTQFSTSSSSHTPGDASTSSISPSAANTGATASFRNLANVAPIAQGAGIPSTEDIMNAPPAIQKTHIEFLRSEIFRHRRTQLIDKRKNGVINGRPTSDDGGVIPEVIQVKQQMDSLKFILLYGDEDLQKNPPDAIKVVLNGYNGTPLPQASSDVSSINCTHSDKMEELQSHIKALESKLATKELDFSTLQAQNDVQAHEFQEKYDTINLLLNTQKEEFAKETASQQKQIKELTQSTQENKNASNNVQTWVDKFNTLSDEYTAMKTKYSTELAELHSISSADSRNSKNASNNSLTGDESKSSSTEAIAAVTLEMKALEMKYSTLSVDYSALVGREKSLQEQLMKLQNQVQNDTSAHSTSTITDDRIEQLLAEKKSIEALLSFEQLKNKQVQSLLQTTLTAVIQDDSNLTQQEKSDILNDLSHQKKFVETASLKQSLHGQKKTQAPPSADGKIISNTNSHPNAGAQDFNDMLNILISLPPQALAMVALPAALLAAILVLIVK